MIMDNARMLQIIDDSDSVLDLSLSSNICHQDQKTHDSRPDTSSHDSRPDTCPLMKLAIHLAPQF